MEDTGTGGTELQGTETEGFVSGPRPKIYHEQRDGALRSALLLTIGGDNSVRFPIAGLTRGRVQSLKNRCYRAGKRLAASHPGVKLKTRIDGDNLCAWLE